MNIKNSDMKTITYMLKRISNLDAEKGYNAEGIELSPVEYAGNMADEILNLINQNSTVQIPETPTKTINWDSDVARRSFNDVFNLAQPLLNREVASTRKIMAGHSKQLAKYTENVLYQRFTECLYSCFDNYDLSDSLPLDSRFTGNVLDWILKMANEEGLN